MTDTQPPIEFIRLLVELLTDIRGTPQMSLPGPRAHLGRDLGLDSLSRGELIQRLEQHYGVQLGDTALGIETVAELWQRLNGPGVERTRPVQPITPLSSSSSSAVDIPGDANTLVEVLQWHAQRTPERTYGLIHGDDNKPPERLSLADLQQGARRVAAGLQARGLQPGDTVALMLPTGVEYFLCFFGCLLAGCVAIPLYPPLRPTQLEEHCQRHQRILANAHCRCLITVQAARSIGQWLRSQVPSLSQVVSPARLLESPPAHTVPRVGPENLAFLQYTSGSTGDPKGVMLNHANLLANIRAAGQRLAATSDDIMVSWLPLYHDMGLIGSALFTLYFSIPAVILSPLTFLRRPMSWLEAVHHHRGTLSAAPNFAFERCLREVRQPQAETLDLSSWRYLLNGAEPVNPDTMERFARCFAVAGLKSEVLAPSYGLAENTVALALPSPGRGLRLHTVDRHTLERDGIARTPQQPGAATRQLVSCGHAIAGHRLRVVDAAGRPLPEYHEGELEFQGPSATPGYYHNAAATAALRHGSWWRTGDRGLLINGEVFITGRMKDVIIRHGRNLYPYELEQAISRVSGIRRGCVAVFSCAQEDGHEQLLVAAETRESNPTQRERLIQEIQSLASDWLDTPADEVLLVPPHTVLKTSSGKIRRVAMAERYRQGLLTQAPGALSGQLLRLGWQGLRGFLWRWLWVAWRGLGQLRASLAIGAGIVCAAVLLKILPTSRCYAVTQWLGKQVFRLAGVQVEVHGAEHLRPPCIVACNHASYADAPVLLASLDQQLRFIAKRELQHDPWLGSPLQRLGVAFIERFDQQQARDSIEQLVQLAGTATPLVIFPEGTFPLQAGILPFRSGAFAAAIQANVPIVPMVIHGTREVLHPSERLPRPGRITLTLLPEVHASRNDWQGIVELRDRVRQLLVETSGEPALEIADSPLINPDAG